METLVLILAAGRMGDEHYSWRGKTPRHLLPIAGEPQIRRDLRLVRRFGFDAVVVTKSEHIKDVVRKVFDPVNDWLIYDTMLSTRELWDAYDRVVFVQGDQLLYEDFLALVFAETKSCLWIADHGPPALAVARRDFGKCERKLRELSATTELNKDELKFAGGFCKSFTYYDQKMYDFDNEAIWEQFLREQPWAREKPKPVLLFLAAGRAQRLSPLSDESPKALLDFGGQSLAERMVDEFIKCGVGEVVVSVGHRHELVEEKLGSERKGIPVRYVFNPDYETTGSGVSVTLARPFLKERFSYVFEGDQLLAPELVGKLVNSSYLDCILVDESPQPENDPGVAAVGTRGGPVEEVVWPASAAEGRADLLGNAPYVLKLSPGGSEILAEFEDDGGVESLCELAKRLPLRYVSTEGLPWAHVNTMRGLAHARDVAFPRMRFNS